MDQTHSIPRFIYGTAWKEEQTRPLTELALEQGFRAIDTANQRKHYFEAGVGEAIAAKIDEGLVTRDDLFIQTKFTYLAGQDHRLPYDPDASFTEQVEQSFASSLDHLQTDHIDSYVLHGPSTRDGLADADREVWRAMERLLANGRVGAIGASNISAEQLEELVDWAEHPPSYVQNRCFARTGWDLKVRLVCEAHGIHYQGFSLLTANRKELETQPMQDIAQKHDRTVAQVVFRFAMQVGMLPLTGTSSEQHMREDLAAFDFELTPDEVDTIERIALR
jgi:diketogulonate reductase-like aldo/keto reductase